MLTLKVLKVSAVKEYIERYYKEYYAHGIYHGKGLDHLNMEPNTMSTKQELINLFCYGSHPKDITQSLNQRAYTQDSVAGFDLSLTPTKSVNILWGLATRDVQDKIEEIHHIALKETIKHIEDNAIYTRKRNNLGDIEHIKSNNLTAAAITHYDSRAGDPDLHTHILLSNKTYYNGKWYSLDGQVLHKFVVTADLYYKNRLETLLHEQLGVNFVNVYKRNQRIPVREVDGISNEIIEFFSKRSKEIKEKYDQLVKIFIKTHKRTPTLGNLRKLLDAANSITKDKKNYTESKADKRIRWRNIFKKEYNLTEKQVDKKFNSVINKKVNYNDVSDKDIENLMWQTLNTVSSTHSTFTKHIIKNEAYRQVNDFEPNPTLSLSLVEKVSKLALDRCISISNTNHPLPYYTTQRLINQEKYIINESIKKTDSKLIDDIDLSNSKLSDRQKTWIHDISDSKTRITVGIGVAGAGKSTSLKYLVDKAKEDKRAVISLAHTAKAAENLGKSVNTDYYTIHNFLYKYKDKELPKDSILIIDEVSMVNSALLYALTKKHKSKILLIGDNKQLQTVDGTSPINYLIKEDGVKVHKLDEIHRFKNKEEADNTLKIRNQDIECLKFYEKHNRIIRNDTEPLFEKITDNYIKDINNNKSSILLGQTISEVAELNRIVQSKLPNLIKTNIELNDHNTLYIGDKIVSRKNDHKLKIINGTTFTVLKVHKLTQRVKVVDNFNRKRYIPLSYIKKHCELGYASSIHRSQGLTVDAAHLVVRENMSVQNLYVGLSRGRENNMIYIPNVIYNVPDISTKIEDKSIKEIFEKILKHTEADIKYSSRELLQQEVKAVKYNIIKLKEELADKGLLANNDIISTQSLLSNIKYANNREQRTKSINELNTLIDKRNNVKGDNNLLINSYINNLINKEKLYNDINLYITYNPLREINNINTIIETPQKRREEEQDNSDKMNNQNNKANRSNTSATSYKLNSLDKELINKLEKKVETCNKILKNYIGKNDLSPIQKRIKEGTEKDLNKVTQEIKDIKEGRNPQSRKKNIINNKLKELQKEINVCNDILKDYIGRNDLSSIEERIKEGVKKDLKKAEKELEEFNNDIKSNNYEKYKEYENDNNKNNERSNDFER